MGKLLFGCNLSPYDIRDYKVGAVANKDLPDEFELDFSNIQIKNQGSVSSCVAHAMSTILEYHAGGKHELSTNFIYGIRKALFAQETKGMYLRDACKIVTSYGDPLEVDCPGNNEVPHVFDIAFRAIEDEQVMNKSLQFRTKSYYLCSTIQEIKEALYNYGPILASIKWYNDYRVVKGILIGGKSKDYGYHAIVIYGWNESGFLCQNSWGKLWGNKGRFILPYDIKIREARGLIDLENDIYIEPPKINPILNFIYKLFNKIVNFIIKR